MLQVSAGAKTECKMTARMSFLYFLKKIVRAAQSLIIDGKIKKTMECDNYFTRSAIRTRPRPRNVFWGEDVFLVEMMQGIGGGLQ